MALGCSLLQDAHRRDETVSGGHVRVNGVRAKPAKEVGVSDTVDVKVGQTERTVVDGLAEARLGDRRDAVPGDARVDREPGAGRAGKPSRARWADLGFVLMKQARRRLDALRRSQRDRRG